MKIYQVDAFTTRVFSGNPAAVVPLEHWLDDSILQSIAAENNLAETAYTVPIDNGKDNGWEIRWFTPAAEVALCGHATLAAAHVLVKHQGFDGDVLTFETRQAGKLSVECLDNNTFAMSFPAITTNENDHKQVISEALGAEPNSVRVGHYSPNEFDYVAIFNSEDTVASLTPNLSKFASLSSRGIIASAPGKSVDFVSRYFAPNIGINEDPVTGSAHCLLAPYWSNISGKTTLQARQISDRGGDIHCTVGNDNRVILAGCAVDYLIGDINF